MKKPQKECVKRTGHFPAEFLKEWRISNQQGFQIICLASKARGGTEVLLVPQASENIRVEEKTHPLESNKFPN